MQMKSSYHMKNEEKISHFYKKSTYPTFVTCGGKFRVDCYSKRVSIFQVGLWFKAQADHEEIPSFFRRDEIDYTPGKIIIVIVVVIVVLIIVFVVHRPFYFHAIFLRQSVLVIPVKEYLLVDGTLAQSGAGSHCDIDIIYLRS